MDRVWKLIFVVLGPSPTECFAVAPAFFGTSVGKKIGINEIFFYTNEIVMRKHNEK